MAHLGYWPAGPDWSEFQRWLGILGKRPTLFRSRGGEGSFNPDDDWLSNSSQAAIVEGLRVSLQIAPKTGTGGNRRGISYRDISAGKHDQFIVERFGQFRTVPDRPRQVFEVHSEANIQDSPPAAQPYSGSAAEYPAFAKKIHELAIEAGVRNKLRFMLSMTKGPWESKEWEIWTKGLDDVIDMYAVDGYSMPKTANAKTFESITVGVREAAAIKGKKWAVMETGCQEDPRDPNYKANWYTGLGAFLQREGKDCHAVVFNLSDDGPGGWMPDTSAKSLSAFKALINSAAFK